MKKNKYTAGGELLKLAASFIPGVGGVVSTGIGLVDQKLEEDKLKQMTTTAPPMKLNLNPYGQFQDGGILNDQFIQYNTGSHSSGNDLPVNEEGSFDPKSQNFVQNKENSFKIKDKQYVMSDSLVNPKTGNTFNVDAMKINKKYPNARFNMDQKNALNLEMEMLSKENDLQRDMNSNKYNYGGPLFQMALKPLYDAQKASVPETNSPFPTQPAPYQGFDMTPQPIEDIPQGVAMDTTDPTNGLPELTLGPDLSMSNPESNENSISNQAQNRNSLTDINSANAIGLGLKGIALAGSISDALAPAINEKLITPNYSKADNYMQSANIDYTQAKQDAVGVSNIGANMNRGLSSNAAQYQGREQARLAQLQDALSRINMNENNAQSQLNLTKGQYETNKAVDNANRRYQREQNQQMNEANSRLFDRNLMSDLTQIGSSFNEYAETNKMIKNMKENDTFNKTQALTMLQAKYPGWSIDPKIVEKYKAGEISMDELLTYKPG